jgi:hypothetical protein
LDDRCILELCDPDGWALGEAIQLARQVSAVEPAMAPHLNAFIDYICGYKYPDRRVMERSLELMRAISDGQSFARVCDRLSRNENPAVRALLRWLLAGQVASRVREGGPVNVTHARM